MSHGSILQTAQRAKNVLKEPQTRITNCKCSGRFSYININQIQIQYINTLIVCFSTYNDD